MKVCAVLCLLMSAFLSSCTSNNRKEIKMQPFPLDKQLIAERIVLKEVFSPGYLMMKGNQLFLTGEKGDTLVYQYQVPEFNCKNKWGVKGQAEDDFQLFPMFAKSQSADVYIWGYTPMTIKRFSLNEDGRLNFKNKYELATYESFNQMHVIRDSILIYSAIPTEFAIKKINLNTGKLLDKISIETEKHRESFFYSNRGYVAANDSFIVYPYVYKKQIDIYSIDSLTLCKRIIGDYSFQEIKIGDFENNRIYYLNVVAGRKNFYALCKGEEGDVFLEVFDYEGHSKARYRFDVVPYQFEVDEERGYIYGYNNEFEDYFLKYRF